jgi:uncharacterized membrane protein
MKRHHALTRVLTAAAVGTPVGVVSARFTAWQASLMLGWVAASAAFLVLVWPHLLRQDAASTAAHATQEDDSLVVADLTLLGSSLVSLVAVGFLLVATAASTGTMKFVFTAVAVVSVVLSWALVHTVFTLRYGRLYHDGAPGGIDFHGDEPPTYHDFAYMAFTIGMTYQVSDTEVPSREIRANVVRHALLSFLFGTSIIAVTINIVANLGK